jgi:hypothetical protein
MGVLQWVAHAMLGGFFVLVCIGAGYAIRDAIRDRRMRRELASYIARVEMMRRRKD